MTKPPARPRARAAIIVGAGVAVLLVFALVAVGGSYVLTLHEIHLQNVASAAQVAQVAQAAAAKAAQIKAAIPTCKALATLAKAQDGIKLPTSVGNNTLALYVLHLVQAIHQVVNANCAFAIKHTP
jgi:fucose 4-O-acetylase-like acetyltransferase